MSPGNDRITSLLTRANLQRTGKSDYLISGDLKSKRERNWPKEIPTKCDINWHSSSACIPVRLIFSKILQYTRVDLNYNLTCVTKMINLRFERSFHEYLRR